MNAVFVIAKNTFREIIRDRILYGLFIFAILLIGLSLVLGQLSFAEQVRISANFGFTAIHLSAVIVSIFIGSTLVTKEMDKKTVMTLLVRPISRLEFLLGKGVGLLAVILVVISFLAAILALVFLGLGVRMDLVFIAALHGIFLESIILLALAIFFSCFATPVMVVAFSVGLFLIGHWMNSLSFFINEKSSEGLRFFAKIIMAIIPNLETFNWRSHVIFDDAIPSAEFISANFYSVSWFVLLLTLSAFLIRRKDFG